MERFSIEQKIKYFEENGYHIVGTHTEKKNKTWRRYFDYTCPNGHASYATWNHFKEGKRCGHCARNKLLSHEFVSSEFLKEKYILLSQFESCMKMLNTTCPRGHAWSTSWNNFQQGYRCKICAGVDNVTANDLLPFLNAGYSLLSHPDVIKNKKSKILIECDQGHRYETSYDCVVHGGHGCPLCSKYREKTEEDIKQNLRPGYTIHTKEYHEKKKCHLWMIKCQKGHIFPLSRKVKKPVCTLCSTSKPEVELKEWLESFGVETKHRKRFGNIEFDLFLPQYNTAIEYCGLYWKKKKKKPKYHIQQKNVVANNLGVKLITILEDEYVYNKERVLDNVLRAINKNEWFDDYQMAYSTKGVYCYENGRLLAELLLLDNVIQEIKYTLGVSLDLSKAMAAIRLQLGRPVFYRHDIRWPVIDPKNYFSICSYEEPKMFFIHQQRRVEKETKRSIYDAGYQLWSN